MSCNSCSTDKSGTPKGCKSNGSCATGGCEKLSVFDWLSNITLPAGHKPYNIVEVRFKNGRKQYFKNNDSLQLAIGDVVAVEGNPGHDIGTVSLTGELVKIQLKKRNIEEQSELVKKIYRKASDRDIEIWQNARGREEETQRRGREILIGLGLKMKLSDVEFQGDGNKATFYYTADERVDFRQLIKDYAAEFKIRIEMKQVGLRQEAARLGGVGSCGRELCCSTWLTDFRKVNTAAARYQQLSLNPQKLAGQCGKLKCCLNYELDTYLDAIKSFPKKDTVLKTERGDAVFVKMDIFKEEFWYTYKDESFKWYKLDLEQLREIIDINKGGEVITSLEDFEVIESDESKLNFEDAAGEDSLTRFDQPKRRGNKRRKSRKGGNRNNAEGGNKQAQNRKDTGDKKQASKGNNNQQRRKQKPQNKQQGKGQNQENNTPKNNQGEKKNRPNPRRKNNNRNKKPKQQGNNSKDA